MKKSWAVELTVEHEYPQPGGIAKNTIKVERGVDGDEEGLDADYAIKHTLAGLRNLYNIGGAERLHVVDIRIMEME